MDENSDLPHGFVVNCYDCLPVKESETMSCVELEVFKNSHEQFHQLIWRNDALKKRCTSVVKYR